MYLITVARAAEEGASGPLPLAALAGSLGVSVASANEMIRKLASKGLVEYLPYKGVELTEIGTRVAGRVLRTRRLWATFCAEHLGFTPSEADALACQLEHVTPPDAAERLAGFLGDPTAGPLGRPIPPDSGGPSRRDSIPLSDVPVGTRIEVAETDAEGALAAFLDTEGVIPWSQLLVAASGESGVLVEIEGRWVHLARDVAALVQGVPHVGR